MYEPEWVGPIEGYVVNFLTANHWKVARTVPREDAMQEAYCVFLRCKRKYGPLDTPQHFMALFKTAWYRHFLGLAKADTADRVTVPYDVEAGHERVGSTDNDGALAIMVRQAPAEVRAVLSLFFDAPQELLTAALGSWKPERNGRRSDGGSEKVNRLLGLPEGTDCMEAVREYFGVGSL
jgi:hypothetical protein